eukprot:TRINITY_DN18452_c0_g1_i1.p6 TRINITY_DN18452_c0_g1~~TRINITY_DN18452_c0_g1_i1.p6  ORF type:complete len:135 (-),score=50.48 TRINITY_DN18452_c0_g1_i1:289-693(-)
MVAIDRKRNLGSWPCTLDRVELRYADARHGGGPSISFDAGVDEAAVMALPSRLGTCAEMRAALDMKTAVYTPTAGRDAFRTHLCTLTADVKERRDARCPDGYTSVAFSPAHVGGQLASVVAYLQTVAHDAKIQY